MYRLFFITCLFELLLHSSTVSDHPLLLLISLDGLNYKFITPTKTPNIWSLGRKGVMLSKGIKSQVMTTTAPNHHCIVTGLYEESHGIIDNLFYDPELDEYFDIWNNTGNSTIHERSLLPHWYMAGEPIWETNMHIEGRLSGSYLWPMGEAEIPSKISKKHKFKPWLDYHDFEEWKKEIDELLEWFTNDTEPINLGLYYNAQPDGAMHHHDLCGENVTQTIRQLDDLIGYLIEGSKKLNLFHKLNMILTADHGHAVVPDKFHLFNITDFVSKDRVLNASTSYFPRPGTNTTEEDIFDNFTRAIAKGAHFSVWRKKDFPKKYHWKNNRRVGPVIAIRDLHYEGGSIDKIFPHGDHGYLNDFEDMNAFFVAHGPAFKNGCIINKDPIENIDIYPLMCHILGVQPAPNNGSLERISAVLA